MAKVASLTSLNCQSRLCYYGINDWDFQEKPAINSLYRTTVSAFGLWLLNSSFRSQPSTVSRAESSAAALSSALCLSVQYQVTDQVLCSSKAQFILYTSGEKILKHTPAQNLPLPHQPNTPSKPLSNSLKREGRGGTSVGLLLSPGHQRLLYLPRQGELAQVYHPQGNTAIVQKFNKWNI